MNRKVVVPILGSFIAAMGLAGVAMSHEAVTRPFGSDPGALAQKAPGTKETLHAAPRVEGQTWRLRSYQSRQSELCLSQDVPGEGVGTTCLPPDRLFADGPLFALHGGRQESANYKKVQWDNLWVYGIAHFDIKTLTLVSMDCSTADLSLDGDGAFIHVLGSETIKRGKWPYKLIGRDAAGQVIAEKNVAIGLPRNGKDAGLQPPQPKQACR